MNLTGYEDLRVQKTISAIYSAFESLIVEKNYEKITVKELAERAKINKKTFYRYYPTLDDLLAELQARSSQDFLETTQKFEYPKDLVKSIRAFFEYSAAQGPAYDKITCNTNYSGIRQQMINGVMAATWEKSPTFNHMTDFRKIILLTFIQNTGLEVYKQWVNDDKKVDLEDVIHDATSLMENGVSAFLKSN